MISIYKNAFESIGKEVKILDVLMGIKNGRWMSKIEAIRAETNPERQDELKLSLPCACFSGTFLIREDDKLIKHSGFICLDIDHVEPIVNKLIVKDDPCVLAVFTSPRGHGIKILCAVGPCDASQHKAAFRALKTHFEGKYGIEVDRSGSNVSRLCYMSYDPEIVINSEYSVFTAREESSPTEKANKDGATFISIKNVGKEKASDNFTIGKCLQWVEKYYQYKDGERNNYIHHFACLLNRVGIEKMVALRYLVLNFDLGEKETTKCVESAYKNIHEHNRIHVNDITKHVPGAGIGPEKARFKISLMEDMADDMFSKIKDATYITTTIDEIDSLTGGGLMLGNFYGIIGREGTMKSIFSQKMSIENAKRDVPVIYVNGEMSEAQFFKRMVKMELGIDMAKQIEAGKMTESDMPALKKSIATVLKSNLYLASGVGCSAQDIAGFIRNINLEKGKDVGLVIVDGISSMADVQDNETFSAIQNSFSLKELAKECNVAVIALVHTKSGVYKDVRDMAEYVRGGIKLTANMDGYFSTSLLIDPSQSSPDDDNPVYREGMFYLRYNDKRDSGKVINKIMEIKPPLDLTCTGFNPEEF
jgi:KaiC/GvpD/RAD55 family RecA-like ATPase